MKTIYSKPVTEIVDLSLKGAFLVTVPITGGSIVTDSMDGNSGSFDEDEADWSMPSNRSLWDD